MLCIFAEMNKRKERIAVAASLLILHAGVAINIFAESVAGNILLLSGVIFLSLVYAAKGIMSIKKDQEKPSISILVLYHTNLIACLYTLTFFYFDMHAFFAAGVLISLSTAAAILIRKKSTKNFSRLALLKSIIFNSIIFISFMVFLF